MRVWNKTIKKKSYLGDVNWRYTILNQFCRCGNLNNKMINFEVHHIVSWVCDIILSAFQKYNILWLHGERDRQNTYISVDGHIVSVTFNINWEK